MSTNPLNFTQKTRLIELIINDDSRSLFKTELLLKKLEGKESISKYYTFNLELLSTNSQISIEDMIAQDVTVRIQLEDGKDRFINGYFQSFAQAGKGTDFTYYQASVVPWLWMLTKDKDIRIFQNLTIPEIVESVFKAYPFASFRFELANQYPKVEYCVQYRESNFNFCSRLLEQEGIYYYFEQEATKHTMVLSDTPYKFKASPYDPTIDYMSATGRSDEGVLQDWIFNREIRSGKYQLRDFNFQQPSQDLTVSIDGKDRDAARFEIYDYPGKYYVRPEGERIVGLRFEEEQTPKETIIASSTSRGVSAGYRFTLLNHYRADFNREYVTTSVEHKIDIGDNYFAGESASDDNFRYSNTFTANLYPEPFRPARTTQIPRVRGTQTAIVVGPKKEEIFVNSYGQVKVQFHWDRLGNRDQHSSCWIRVGSLWADRNFGVSFIPRVGQEVIVDFLEGDPDKPIIVGCVYNAEHKPPYALPQNKTISTIHTRSTPGGSPQNYQEIGFDDQKGKERLWMQAERDMKILVKNNQTININGSLTEQVGGNETQVIKKTKKLQVLKAYLINVLSNIAMLAQGQILIKSLIKIKLQVGASSIVISPESITLTAPIIYSNPHPVLGGEVSAGPADTDPSA